MFDISQPVHDTIFAAGAFVLWLALIPAVIRRSILPLSTCYLTGGVLFIFTLNYLTMEFWYATVVETANVAAWAYLFAIAWKHREPVPVSPTEGLPPTGTIHYNGVNS